MPESAGVAMGAIIVKDGWESMASPEVFITRQRALLGLQRLTLKSLGNEFEMPV